MLAVVAQTERLRQLIIILGDQKNRNTTNTCQNCTYLRPAIDSDTYAFNMCAHPNSIDLVRGTNLPAVTARHTAQLCSASGTWFVHK